MAGLDQGLQVGAVVGSYRIEALIGRGGMGTVYLAEQVHLRRRVALKVLPPSLADDPDFRERFIRESQLAASIDHPNIMPVHDANDADGVLYLAMRYVEGSDLKSVLSREGRLSPTKSLAVLEQVARGLDAAHARGLVHRDIKPANVLIEDATGHVFVTDFGIAKLVSATGITRTGFFLGTIEYAAPEQIEGKLVDRRTDVYALGCLLFTCLAGQPPYVRDSEVAVMHAHLIEPPPTITELRPELPPALDTVVAKAMAKRPEDRYPTAGALAQALSEALGQQAEPLPTVVEERPAQAAAGTTQRAPGLLAPTATPGPRRRLWLYAAALLALVGAGVAVAVVTLAGGGGGDATPSPSKPVALGLAAPLTLPIRTAGQSATLTFAGKAGQRVFFSWAKNTIAGYTGLRLLSPTGSALIDSGFSGEQGELEPQQLPASGRYELHVDPQASNTGSVTLTRSIVPADASGTLRPGVPVTLPIRTAGQSATLTFAGKAGQRVFFSWAKNTIAGYTGLRLLSPTGSALIDSGFSGEQGELEPQQLPASGRYELHVDPQASNTGSVTLTRSIVPADASGTLRPGVPVTLPIRTAGQSATLTFAGKAGQRVFFSWAKNTIAGYTGLRLLSPTGSALIDSGFSGEQGELEPQQLPASGRYELHVDPQASNTGSVTLTRSIVPADASGTLRPGVPVTLPIRTAGQSATLTFAGKAGQRVFFSWAKNTIAGYTGLRLLSPTGSALIDSGFSGEQGELEPQQLPASGRYELHVDPQASNTGSVTLTRSIVPADASGTLRPGVPVTLPIRTAGQSATLTFAGKAGQRVFFSWAKNTIAGYTGLRLLSPTGSALIDSGFSGEQGELEPQQLPASGRYELHVDPQASNTGSVTLTLEPTAR